MTNIRSVFSLQNSAMLFMVLFTVGFNSLIATSSCYGMQDPELQASLQATETANQFDLLVTVTIPNTWNTYGSSDEVLPTTLSLDEADGFKLVGDAEIPEGDEKDTSIGKRHYLFGEFVVRQRIEVTSDTKSVDATGSVRMMLCQKEVCKRPRSFKFSLSTDLSSIAAHQPVPKTGQPKTTASSASQPLNLKTLQQDLAKVIDRARESTVAIMMPEMGGNGSGVIVSPDGLVLTAGHCFVEPNESVVIVLHDGREFPAKGVGLEPGYDCGLVKIEPESLGDETIQYTEMGWSSQLKVNEPVFSIAHGGLYNAQRGAYLRFGRVIDPCCEVSGFIQNTCLMEPGDSGGPLFNMDGRLVGIRSMIQEKLDENYDVPIDLFRRHWQELNRAEKFRWSRSSAEPGFGIRLIRGRNSMMSGGPTDAGKKRGVRIASVDEESWVAKCGLQRSDRALTWDGQKILDPKQLNLKMINAFSSGVAAKLEVRRGRETADVNLDFGQLDSLRDSLNAIQPDRSQSIAGQSIQQLEELAANVASLENRLDEACVSLSSGSEKSTATMAFWVDGNETKWVVGKSDLIADDEVKVTTASNQTISGKVIARSEDHDLALIELAESVAIAAELRDVSMNDSLIRGQFLVSPSQEDDGLVSIQSAPRFSTMPPGLLGVMAKKDAEAFVVEDVEPEGAADSAGLKPGDTVVKLNETKIESFKQATDFLAQTRPGQKISVTVDRDGETLTKELTLGGDEDHGHDHGGPGHIADQFEGGASEQTTYPSVILHDARVLASKCGGPVFDLDGKFVGINIARKSRTRTYILPAMDVQGFVESHAK